MRRVGGHQADGVVIAEQQDASDDPQPGAAADKEGADPGERAVAAQQVPGEGGDRGQAH
jgi:hypothetical protein